MGIKVYKSLFLILYLFTLSQIFGETLQKPSPNSQVILLEKHFREGNQYLDKGAYELAIREYEQVLQIDSTYRPAYRKLGDSYRYLNNPKNTIDYYLKFVGLSKDTTDNEGKHLLLDVAKIYDENLHDSNSALRALDGLLTFYYPESYSSVKEIVNKYRDKYLAALTSTGPDRIYWKDTDPIWREAMLYKGSLLRRENHNKEAYEVYIQYFALARYRDKAIHSQAITNEHLPPEWREMYFANMSKGTPEDWKIPPWIIELSPEHPDYQSDNHDRKRYENSTYFSLQSFDEKEWDYIFQAKTGYRISKLELSADIDAKTDDSDPRGKIFPFKSGGYINGMTSFVPPVFNVKFNWPKYIKKGKQQVSGTLEFADGIHAIKIKEFELSNNDSCYKWSIHSEFIPETGKDTQIRFEPNPPGVLVIYVHPLTPYGPTHFIVDDGVIDENKEHYLVLTGRIKTGEHKVIIDRPGFPKKELKFNWDGKTSQFMDVWLWTEWNRETTNLIFPSKTNDIQIFQDLKGVYRLIVVVNSDKQSDIYSSSSKDLLNWSPLEKLSINSWAWDHFPQIIGDSETGLFHLFWISNRSSDASMLYPNELWESSSNDFQKWSRPQKAIQAIPNPPSYSRICYIIFRDKSGKYRFYSSNGFTNSGDGTIWNNPDTTIFSQTPSYYNERFLYSQLSDGRYLAIINDNNGFNFFVGDDSKDFKKVGSLPIKDDQMNFPVYMQFIEYEASKYGLLWDAPNHRYLTKSSNLSDWTEPHEIIPLSSPEDYSSSNLVRDKKGRFIFINANGVLWSTPDLK